MAAVQVFVDDAVRGSLPDVCAKDGVAATSRLTVTTEIGRGNRLGILWLLVLAGPLGWVILVILALRPRGELLVVEVPYSRVAYDRMAAARHRRDVALWAGGLGALALAGVSVWVGLGAAGALLVVLLVVATAAVAVRAEIARLRASVRVELDASRRWVTLDDVHPAFADACAAIGRSVPAGARR